MRRYMKQIERIDFENVHRLIKRKNHHIETFYFQKFLLISAFCINMCMG